MSVVLRKKSSFHVKSVSQYVPSRQKLPLILVLISAFLISCAPPRPEKTDEFYINSAVKYIVENEHSVLVGEPKNGGGITMTRSSVKYKSVEEFRSENPQCCILGRRASDSYRPPCLQKPGVHEVTITWRRKYQSSTGIESVLKTYHFGVNDGGQVCVGELLL